MRRLKLVAFVVAVVFAFLVPLFLGTVATAAPGGKGVQPAAPAVRPMIARKGAHHIRLGVEPCSKFLPGWRGGDARLEGAAYKLCWKMTADELGYLVIFEDGDGRIFPRDMFVPEGGSV